MTLIERILSQCSDRAERAALIEGERVLSYPNFGRCVRGRAGRLRELALAPGDRVAVALGRGIEAAVSIYAVLSQGLCYVPLDPGGPVQRLRSIIDDARPAATIGAGPRPEWLPSWSHWLDIESLSGRSAPILLPHPIDCETLAAILYTSGSAGVPKGIAISHRALAAFADWAGARFSIGAGDRIASLAPFHFDLSVFDLFTSLCRGAAVDFVPTVLTRAPSRLSAWLDDRAITCWYTVPSILAFLALKGNLSARSFRHLRRILFAGEVFPTSQLIRLAALLPGVQLFNLYGPTETNVCCYWPVERTQLDPDQPIPIGGPACGAQLLLDQGNGELLVRGPAVMSGYWKSGRLDGVVDRAHWHRTGDRVSRNAAGEYMYHGRLDRMLKWAGYRIEPAEIEASVCGVPGVRQCAVVGVPDATGGQRPVAAVVFDGHPDLSGLTRQLRRQLPSYMQPARLVPCASLPHLANGKIDYRRIERKVRRSVS